MPDMKKRNMLLRDLIRERHHGVHGERILALVLAGRVRVDGELVRDPRRPVYAGCKLEVDLADPLVSRGAGKLFPVLDRWRVETEGKVFLDAGSASGGFTQALLLRGARAVHAVDVGYNLLDYRMRRDTRVMVHERTNIMDVSRSDLDPPVQAAVADLSFRSLSGACSHIMDLLEEQWMICLVKPQFEWRNPDRMFDGVIQDEDVLREVLRETASRLEREGCIVGRVTPSVLRGRKGNREFFFLVSRGTRRIGDAGPGVERMIDSAVADEGEADAERGREDRADRKDQKELRDSGSRM